MKTIETIDYADMSRKAAEHVIGLIRRRPSAVCVFPTGETPIGLYRELVAAQRAGTVDFSKARFVILDEYTGIGHDDRRRLSLWLARDLLQPLGVAESNIHPIDPTADPGTEALRIETIIANHGGIDLAVLGLGRNGHLGFNEPGSAFDSRTRPVELTPESIRSNAAYWGSETDVPRAAITLGLGTIADAGTLVMLASGARKADILSRVMHGPIGPEVPATLFRSHRDATIIADREALSAAMAD